MIDLRDGLFMTRIGVDAIRTMGAADFGSRAMMVLSVVIDAVLLICAVAIAVALVDFLISTPMDALLWIAGGLAAAVGVVMLGRYFVERAVATGAQR